MGFPVGYSDLLLPRFLFLLLSLLGHLRKLITFSLRAAGLGDLLLDPADQEPSHDPHQRPDRRHHHCHLPHSTAARIRSLLPEARYGDLGGVEDVVVPKSCAVCLHEFGCEDEVRRLSNCRHVFHSGCIDPWVELDQRTCPLCRAALVPDELLRAGRGALELGWGGGGGSGASLYPLADPLRFVVSSHLPQVETLPWFLLPPDAAAATAPELELW